MQGETMTKTSRLSGETVKDLAAKYSLILVVLLLGVILSVTTNTFLTATNLINVLRQVSINGILAIGMTFVILTGGIDLTVGATVALAGIMTAGFLRDQGWNTWGVFFLAVAVGLAVGLINGYFVAFWKAAPFVVTLSTMSIARGITYVYSDARPISPLPQNFLNIGTGNIMEIPTPTVVFILLFIIGYIILKHFSIGRYIYAVGGNENAALVSGINVRRVLMFVYAASGVLCGIAAVVLTSRVSAGLPTAGEGYEMDAIAATVIGGTSMSGGRRKLWGTVLGTLLIGMIANGLDLLNVSSFYQQIFKGIIILAAVLIDSKRNH